MLAQQRIVPPPPSGWNSWEAVMQEALAEAALAENSQEVPVGALVLGAGGKILGRGHNRAVVAHDPTAHAEIVALKDACRTIGNYRLDKAVLVVTLEPCLMCAGAMAHARIEGLVYGASDTRAGAVASCLDALELPFLNHRVWHMGGILEQECSFVLRHFFEARR